MTIFVLAIPLACDAVAPLKAVIVAVPAPMTKRLEPSMSATRGESLEKTTGVPVAALAPRGILRSLE